MDCCVEIIFFSHHLTRQRELGFHPCWCVKDVHTNKEFTGAIQISKYF